MAAMSSSMESSLVSLQNWSKMLVMSMKLLCSFSPMSLKRLEAVDFRSSV